MMGRRLSLILVFVLLQEVFCENWERLWKFSSDSLAPEPSPRSSHGMVVLNDIIYIHGGLHGDSTSIADCWKYSISNQQWKQITFSPNSIYPTARSRHVMIAKEYNNISSLYIFGGDLSQGPVNNWMEMEDTNELWRLELSSEPPQWFLEHDGKSTLEQPTPSSRVDFVSVEYHNEMFIFGGLHINVNFTAINFQDLWAYSFETKSWRMVVPSNGESPPPRFSHAGCLQKGKGNPKGDSLVIHGGITVSWNGDIEGLDDLWVYYFESNTWHSLEPSASVPRSYHTLVATDSRIWLFGGCMTLEHTMITYVYNDIKTGNVMKDNSRMEWMAVNELRMNTFPQARCSHRSVMWLDALIVHGGRFKDFTGDMWKINTTELILLPLNDPFISFVKELSVTSYFIIGMTCILMICIIFFVGWVKKRMNTPIVRAEEPHNSCGLRIATIQKINVIKYHKPKNVVVQEEGSVAIDLDAEICPICLSNFDEDMELRELPCKHLFHPPCIDQWLATHYLCPMCKKCLRYLEETSHQVPSNSTNNIPRISNSIRFYWIRNIHNTTNRATRGGNLSRISRSRSPTSTDETLPLPRSSPSIELVPPSLTYSQRNAE